MLALRLAPATLRRGRAQLLAPPAPGALPPPAGRLVSVVGSAPPRLANINRCARCSALALRAPPSRVGFAAAPRCPRRAAIVATPSRGAPACGGGFAALVGAAVIGGLRSLARFLGGVTPRLALLRCARAPLSPRGALLAGGCGFPPTPPPRCGGSLVRSVAGGCACLARPNGRSSPAVSRVPRDTGAVRRQRSRERSRVYAALRQSPGVDCGIASPSRGVPASGGCCAALDRQRQGGVFAGIDVDLLLSDALDLYDYGGDVWLSYPNGDGRFADSIADIYKCHDMGGSLHADKAAYQCKFGETIDI